ncbi:hypothetical protein [Bifidobacterium longum]|uniref:hypothetical protein n=1 Tax=Bifidobacterium longum TaxID=216816 RepID=UPI0011B1C680|nr:hypothetical protein [Bifidobacterium longum]
MSTTHTRLVRRIAMLTSALSLASMLGACSSPLAAVGTGSGADDRSDATTTTDATAKRFAACLTGKGFDARTAAGVSSGSGSGKQAPTKNAVALRMIGTDGKPVASQGNSLSASDDGPQLYPNAAYTSMEDDSTWVVFKGRQGARRLTLRIQTAGIRRLRGQEPRLHPAHSGHGAATPVFRGRQAGGARLRPGRA